MPKPPKVWPLKPEVDPVVDPGVEPVVEPGVPARGRTAAGGVGIVGVLRLLSVGIGRGCLLAEAAAPQQPAAPRLAAGSRKSCCAAGPDAGNRRAPNRLPEEAHSRGSLVLAKVHRLPILLAGDRVRILLAHESDFVGGLDQSIDVGRIGIEFLVVHPDSSDVLLAAVHGLQLVVALNLLGDLGQGDGQRDNEQRQHENDRNQDVALLGGTGAADWGGLHHLAVSF